ncbi:hypothetical protein C8R47DRAFT_1076464 [Mycena vitilis]|nr:hypothetical protein C8R47DRAFT_1076464 [Mycena vitilis]
MDPALAFLNSLDAPNLNVTDCAVGLVEDVIHSILELVAQDDSLSFKLAILVRGNLMLSCRWVAYRVYHIPSFWTRVVVNPRTSPRTVQLWFARSNSLPISVSIRASESDGLGEYLDIEYWLSDVVEGVAAELHRCSSLRIAADSSYLVDDVLSEIEGTSPVLLRELVVQFGFERYHELIPYGMQQFEFDHAAPLGDPFRPFTSLNWRASNIPHPSVTFTISLDAECNLLHPRGNPAAWPEVVAVLTRSPCLAVLVLDGIALDNVPSHITCSPPLSSVRDLELNFQGLYSAAFLASRLNLPALRRLKIIVGDVRDVPCICACSNLLSTVDEFVLAGACRAGWEFHAIFSLLRRVTSLDLKDVSPVFFAAFVSASRTLQSPLGTTNWNSCPLLRRLLVRATAGYPQLEYVCVCQLAGGRNATVEAWFGQQGVTLVMA